MNPDRMLVKFLAFFVALAPAAPVSADPCGMVPPVWIGEGKPITRIGLQKTYVFYKDGIESLVIRPGFEGRVDQFGMLIPFPSPPAIRKVADDVFPHVAAAVDPPEVVVDLRQRFFVGRASAPDASSARELAFSVDVAKDEVVVLREEAVGMYEVAVLEAGSAAALQRWMDTHGFRYPAGMDGVCEDYVESGWCFVAVKARVGQKSGTDPRPGMRSVDADLPDGAAFDGHVQAMGFRFRSDRPVVPMRLSAFNEGDLRNIVYVLSDEPTRVANLSAGFVVRQVPGHVLYRNLTAPLPLRVIGGQLSDIPEWRKQSLDGERDPRAHNGIARELFASDLLAARTERLTHPHEDREKELLEIGERLGLRGADLDAMHAQVLSGEREDAVERALADLADMTLTVIDGDFPREVIAAENLEFAPYTMPAKQNLRSLYDARVPGPGGIGGWLGSPPPATPRTMLWVAAACLAAVLLVRRRQVQMRRLATVSAAGFAALAIAFSPVGAQDHLHADEIDAGFIDSLAAAERARIERLVEEAWSGASITSRGWAIVALVEIGSPEAKLALRNLEGTPDSDLVRTWACAAGAKLAATPGELVRFSQLVSTFRPLARPVTKLWNELLNDPEREVRLELVLQAVAHDNGLRAALLLHVLERDPAELVAAMLSGEQQATRNLAAGLLATLASQGREGIAGAVLRGLDLDRGASGAPWGGGALFVPSLPWSQHDARALMRRLVGWHVLAGELELTSELAQIHNNLSSWGLANAAGYSLPGRQIDTTRWLLLYGEVAGAGELRTLLQETGVEDDTFYQAVLTIVSSH